MTLTSIKPAKPTVATSDRVPADRPPHLLFVVRGAESYGTETKMLGFLEALTSRGLSVTLFALGNGPLVDAARILPGLKLHVDPAAPPRFVAERTGMIRAYFRTAVASIAWMWRLRAFATSQHDETTLSAGPFYDAMVICEHGLALPIGAVARGSGVTTFWVMANGVSSRYPFDLNRRLYAFAFRHLNLVPVANSEHTRATLGRGAGFAARIDLGINAARLNSSSKPTLPTVAAGGIRLLIMARLVEIKGQKLLLQAILRNPAFAEMHLILCGGPLGTPYERDLRREAAAMGADNRLHLLGRITDVAGYYAMADVVVNARLDPEPFGLSIVEAMLMGKPVLAHAAGGPGEIVVNGVTGWHIAAPTVQAFSDGLSRMLKDRAAWPSMGQAGRDRARQRYTHHTMTGQFLDIVRTRLNR